jgi:L-methionine (R)-S-oxide reductase
VDSGPDDQGWLKEYIAAHDGLAGTVHREHDGDLHLTAAVNIPPPVLERVTKVPRGKGMAGIAQVQGRPVQTCNLQEEDSGGQINPMAKLVGGQAAIALPVADGDGAVRAVVGIAFGFEGEIGADLEGRLAQTAATLP